MSLTSTLPLSAEPASISSALEAAVVRLTRAGVVSPRVDAELLLGHVLGLSRGGVQAKAFLDSELNSVDDALFAELVLRRAAREPLQHITGKAPFRSLELSIGPGAFVPRPETEQVAQFAIDALRAVPSETPLGVDLGTGSGAIALAMASEVPHARIWGVENSPEAYIQFSAEVFSPDGEVTNEGTRTFLRHYMEEYSAFVQRVLAANAPGHIGDDDPGSRK